jgi:orotate phosphoribosyltransferase
VIGHEVGRALGVRALFAERQDGELMLRRGFVIAENDRVLVVEDVLTTGGSTRETMQVARASGGQVVGAASIVNRSGGRAAFDVPFASLLDIDLPTYEPNECPLCAQGLPVIKPGSRPVLA